MKKWKQNSNHTAFLEFKTGYIIAKMTQLYVGTHKVQYICSLCLQPHVVP